eukprot:1156706-Pelagomonas_calceolata.AAC.4
MQLRAVLSGEAPIDGCHQNSFILEQKGPLLIIYDNAGLLLADPANVSLRCRLTCASPRWDGHTSWFHTRLPAAYVLGGLKRGLA